MFPLRRRPLFFLYTPSVCRYNGEKKEAVHEDDTTLFVRGAGFRDFERRGLMFPVLAHA